MIVVVGSPVGSRRGGAVEAGGLGVAVARAAAGAGGRVELVGKVADGAEGDAILLSVAAAGVGHVAVIRSVGRATIDDRTPVDGSDASLEALAGLDGRGQFEETVAEPPAGPALDAGDLELALRYLPDYDVVVIAQPLDDAATAAVVDAAQWANALLVVIRVPASSTLPADATVLEPPADDPEGPFADVVGRYAAALDRGDEPGDAFATASRDLGWTPVGSE